jgi:hypothetical protein
MDLKVYIPQTNSRIRYIFSCLLNDLCGISFDFCTDQEAFKAYNGPRMSYSDESALPGVSIWASGFLGERGIRNLKPSFETVNGNQRIFIAPRGYDLDFDCFSAAFYLISRYEEYLPFAADAHGRFPASESILHQADLLERPLVNEWALQLMRLLKQAYPDLEWHPRRFEYISTLDIDQAWKYLNKGWLRNIGGYARDFIKRDFALIRERYGVMSGELPDPYFNFDWQFELHQQHPETRIQYFILLGNRSRYDKSISHLNEGFIRLMEDLSKRYELGIHPSYKSNAYPSLIKKEIERLQYVTNKDVSTSRQHFLMHEMPKTYQRLLKLGITEDHTLGYSTHMGFRAGIAAPFYFFDLEKEEETELEIYPFCIMDITALHYEQLSPAQAILRHEDLLKKVKSVGGSFVSLWHNESLSENGRWNGWRKVYEALFRSASKANEQAAGYR